MRMIGLIGAAFVTSMAFLAPADARNDSCSDWGQRDCYSRGTSGPEAFARSMTSMRWKPQLHHDVVRVVSRMDVEALRLLQRMP